MTVEVAVLLLYAHMSLSCTTVLTFLLFLNGCAAQDAKSSRQRAAFCQMPPPSPSPSGLTRIDRKGCIRVYENLYLHNNVWYAVVAGDQDTANRHAKIAKNTKLVYLPVKDVELFLDNLEVCHVPGVSLLVDFPFPAYPENLGHLAEIMWPTYSALRDHPLPTLLPSRLSPQLNSVLLTNLNKDDLPDWFLKVMAVALSPATDSFTLPQFIQKVHRDGGAVLVAGAAGPGGRALKGKKLSGAGGCLMPQGGRLLPT